MNDISSSTLLVSTLITSAPRDPRILPVSGNATYGPNSTTLMPANAAGPISAERVTLLVILSLLADS